MNGRKCCVKQGDAVTRVVVGSRKLLQRFKNHLAMGKKKPFSLTMVQQPQILLRETKNPIAQTVIMKETYTLSMKGGVSRGKRDKREQRPRRLGRLQGKEDQTPCGVGCCTGAATSLACPCTS